MKLIKYFIFCLLTFLNICIHADIDTASLRQTLSRFPLWNDTAILEPLSGGLTNQNYKLILPQASYFVRVNSGDKAILGLDPEREYLCTKQAADIGIAPPILWYDPLDQVIVTPFIDAQRIELDDLSRQRIIKTVKAFHLSGKELPHQFCPYQAISDYYQHALSLRTSREIPLSKHILSIMDEIKVAIPQFTNTVPCHLDLHKHNFLDDGKKIWIIDWEYAAMADPFFDLASWISVDQFSEDQIRELLSFYLDHPTQKDLAHLYLLSILAEIRWGFWYLVQNEISTIDFPYEAFAFKCFDEVLKKAQQPLYRESLDLLLKPGRKVLESRPLAI